jgi:CBS-domain-containing membrane protein
MLTNYKVISELIEKLPPADFVIAKDSIFKVLDKLSKYKLVSIPVLCDDQWKGQVAIYDIIRFYLSDHPQAKDFSGPIQNVLDMLEHQKGSPDTFLGVIIIPYKTSCVMNITSLFEPFSKGIHDVLIHNDNVKKVYKIITSYDILSNIIKNRELIHHSAKYETIDKLDCISVPALSVSCNTNILEAYSLIQENRIEAVAITNPDTEEVMGTLSISDFVKNTDETLNQMNNQTVKDFICCRHGNIRLPITAHKKETFLVVLDRFIKEGVHRIWVVDSNKKLLGLVSVSDIFRVMNKWLLEVKDK